LDDTTPASVVDELICHQRSNGTGHMDIGGRNGVGAHTRA
jgi:hypothetical protein